MTHSPSPWPENFPRPCPPAEAQPINGTIYRFISKMGMKTRDFETHSQRGNGSTCQHCGLSVYIDITDVVRAKENIPGMAKKQVAAAHLQPIHGVIQDTSHPDNIGHHTWWVFRDVNIMPLFAIVPTPRVV